MVYIITGPKNSGKTTKAIKLFQRFKNAAGVFSIKRLVEGIGMEYYFLFQNSTLMPIRFASEKNVFTVYPSKEVVKFKRFYFSLLAFKMAESFIIQSIKNGKSPIFIDEIGLFEIETGLGFSYLVKELIKREIELYLTVRDEYLEPVVQAFKIKEYKLLKED